MSRRCRWDVGRCFQARRPRSVTPITRQACARERPPRLLSRNANFTAFGPRRTAWPFSAAPSPP
jgi:hypothetical protein